MRKNGTPADPELRHICLSLKNRLFHKTRAGRPCVHTKYLGSVGHDKPFTQSPEWRESEALQLPSHLLTKGCAPPAGPLACL